LEIFIISSDYKISRAAVAYNQDFSMGEKLAGLLGRSLQTPWAGDLGQKLGDFCNFFFNKNNAFLCIYGQNKYFKGRL